MKSSMVERITFDEPFLLITLKGCDGLQDAFHTARTTPFMHRQNIPNKTLFVSFPHCLVTIPRHITRARTT